MAHKVLLLDDDTSFTLYFSQLLSNNVEDVIVFRHSKIKDAEKTLKNNPDIDVFFLDISLKSKLSDNQGYNFARKIRMEPNYAATPIIFVTGYDCPLPEAINEIRCFKFLTKPVADETFISVFEEAVSTKAEDVRIPVRLSSGSLMYIKVSDILYITSEVHYQYYHTINGTVKGIRSSLEKIKLKSDDTLFYCSRNTLINKNYVTSIDYYKNCLTINDETFKIGYSYKKKLKELIKDD